MRRWTASAESAGELSTTNVMDACHFIGRLPDASFPPSSARNHQHSTFDISQGDQHIPLFGGDDALRQSFAHLLQGGELLIGQRFQTKRSYTEKYAPSGGGASGNARSRSSNINVFHPPWFVPCHSEIWRCRRKLVPSLGEKWPARNEAPTCSSRGTGVVFKQRQWQGRMSRLSGSREPDLWVGGGGRVAGFQHSPRSGA